MLELRLLGPPAVRVDGAPVKLATRKALWLLAYLGVEGATPRRELATLLWPDRETEAAHRNLRTELYRLGRTAVAPFLEVNWRDVLPVGEWRVDARAPADAPPGDFLEGETPEEGPLEEWVRAVRARLDGEAREGLLRAMRGAERDGDLVRAREAARALTELDPLDEAAWRDLVRLCVLGGEAGLARAAYRAAEEVLDRELGVAPGPELRFWHAAARPERPAPGAVTNTPLAAPMVGREAAWRALEAAAQPTLLLGEPGVGKSRLALEFSAQHRPRLVVRGLPEARRWPLGAITLAWRASAERGLGRDRDLPAADRALLARLLPGPAPDGGPGPSLVDASPELRRALFEALGRAALPALRGGTLVLDDLHDFDDLSLEAVRHLLLEAAHLPRPERPRVLLTARAPELAAHDAAQALVRELEARGDLRRLALEGLGETGVLALVRGLGRTGGGARFAARLHAATGGNPLFVLETLRHLRERGDLREDERGAWHTRFDDTTEDYAELDLPGSVTGAVEARLVTLGDETRRALEALALGGRPLGPDVLEAASGLDPWRLLDALGAAASAGFAVERAGKYGLAHALHRAALLGGLPDARRRVLHRALARALDADGAPAREVAEHLLAAGREREAGEALLRAAAEAGRVSAAAEALALLDRALALDLDPDTRARVHAAAFDLHQVAGNLPAARPHLDALRRLANASPDGTLPREADSRLALQRYQESEYHEVVALTDRLLAAPLDPPLDPVTRTRAHLARGLAAVRLGRLDEAEAHLRAALAQDALGRTRWSFQVHAALTSLFLPRGRFDEARRHADLAVEEARVLRDPALVAQALLARGTVHLAAGEIDAASDLLRESLDLAREHGPAPVAAMARLNLGGTLMSRRRHREARVLFEEALHDEHLRPELRDVVRNNLGAVQFALGALDEARALLEGALEAARARGLAGLAPRRALALLDLRLAVGEPVPAADLAAVRAEVEEIGLGELRHYLASLDLARALLAGDPADLAAAEAALAALDPTPDEAERHRLLLAEARLRARDPLGAREHLAHTPASARRAALDLALRELEGTAPTAAQLREARRQLAADTTPALDAARLAARLARASGRPEDAVQAARLADELLARLPPERRPHLRRRLDA